MYAHDTHVYASDSIYSHVHMCSVSLHVLLQTGAAIKLSIHLYILFRVLVQLCFETCDNYVYSLNL